MKLINEAENEVRSYELSLKKDLLYYYKFIRGEIL